MGRVNGEKREAMKRQGIGSCCAVAVGLVAASSALAAMIEGTPGDDRLRGTMDADVIRGVRRGTTSSTRAPATT